MITEKITDEALREAARVIKDGGLVGFPTETVYGLGADAFNAAAVARIYQAKGRPSDNPLILHVYSIEAALALTVEPSPVTVSLMRRFWPGPLTLVMRKAAHLPGWIGGHPDGKAETVAVRMPSHPAAQQLITYAGCAIAAPSANKAGTPSPSRAEHVADDLSGDIEFLLDGGPVPGGLESTVADVTGGIPVILRPGAVTAEMLRAVIGEIGGDTLRYPADTDGQPRSPGMKYRHYAPRAPMTVVTGEPLAAASYIAAHAAEQTERCGILATVQTVDYYRSRPGLRMSVDPPEGGLLPDEPLVMLTVGDRSAPETIARALYACLRRFDELGVAYIYAEGVDTLGLGQAIMNRLVKAAGGRVVTL